MNRTLSLLAASALLASCTTTPAPKPDPLAISPAPEGTLTVAMTASTEAAIRQTEQFAAWVTQATGRPTRAVTFPDYDTLATALAKGIADVALLPPLAYVRAQEQAPIEPLARIVRKGQTSYRAVLYSAPESPLKSLDDLKKAKNLKAAWVDATSSTGYLFPKALLVTSKIPPAGLFSSQDFYGSHDAACRAVLEGKADLGATFNDDPPGTEATSVHGCRGLGEQAAKLQVIAATQSIPNDVLAVKPGAPAELKAALGPAALALSGTEQGKQTLAAAFNAEGFAAVGEEDWAPVSAALEVFRQQ